MQRRTTRRDFLRETAAAGLGFWVAGISRGLAADRDANSKIRVACVGVGGKGSSDCDQSANYGEIVAICDIDDNFLNAKAQAYPSAKKFHDFREMLTKMEKDIDAVTVSTPDHTHAAAAIMAMKLKKHVYCQKPLTYSVFEAREMRKVAAEKGVATQMGNQGTAHNGFRTAVEVIQSGVLGKISEAHVWTNRPVWPQSPTVTKRPTPSDPPKHVHWDLWLGPAPERPWANYPKEIRNGSGAYHDFAWRGWWDFGTGALGDMACHTANMAFMALKLGYPTSVVAENEPLNDETYPGWAKVTFEFPARGEFGACKFIWYEGKRDGKKLLPPEDLTRNLKLSDSGSIIVGEKGFLYSPSDYGADWQLHPAKNFEGFKPPEPKLPRHNKNNQIDNMMKQEWFEAIKGGPKPMSNFDYAALLTETILLGNVAMRAGKKLEWDGPNLKFTNDKDANKLLHREYRKGWTL